LLLLIEKPNTSVKPKAKPKIWFFVDSLVYSHPKASSSISALTHMLSIVSRKTAIAAATKTVTKASSSTSFSLSSYYRYRAMSSSPSSSSSLSEWATIDPKSLGTTAEPYAVQNLVDGKWCGSRTKMEIIHPLDKDAPPIFTIPDTQADEIQPFLDSLRKVPKSGVHNPLKNPERYVQFGEISRKVP